MRPDAGGTLVLGLGNVLMMDDGLGVVAVDRFQRRYDLPEDVTVLDGGTLGLFLLPYIEQAERLVLVDAVQAVGRPPGAFVRLEGEEVPAAVATRLSPHQVGVADLLAGAHLIDSTPKTLVLLGLVPGEVELGTDRTPAVEGAIDDLIAALATELERLGSPARRHHRPPGPDPVAWRTPNAPATPD